MLDNLSEVYKLDTNGNVLASFHSDLSPQDLDWGGNGLWMGTASGLVKVDSTGAVMDRRNGLYYWWHSGFAWDGQYFWVGDYNAGNIYKYTADGTLILYWNADFFGHPTGISADAKGLWIAGSGEGFDTFPDIFHYSFSGQLLYSFNPRTLGIPLGVGSFGCVVWDGSSLWYSPDSQFTVYRLQLPD
jgi:hypothetical protein